MKRYKNQIIFGLALGLLLLLMFWAEPRQIESATWHPDDKQAFGGYVLHRLLPAYTETEAEAVFESLYRHLSDSLSASQSSYLLIADALALDSLDWHKLKRRVKAGHTAIISAHAIAGAPQEELGFQIKKFSFNQDPETWQEWLSETRNMAFQGPAGFPTDTFALPQPALAYYLADNRESDTLFPYQSLAGSAEGFDFLRRYTIGEGQLYLSTTPLLFSNYFLVDSNAAPLALGLLSLLPAGQKVEHYAYYQLGRMEAQSQLRFVLSQPSLRLGLAFGLLLLLLYMVLGVRREQRPIPVLAPPSNQSLAFVRTLGALHWQNGDQSSILSKRMAYWQDYVFRRFRLRITADEKCWQDLRQLSRAPADSIETLKKAWFLRGKTVDLENLKRLDQALDSFYQNT